MGGGEVAQVSRLGVALYWKLFLHRKRRWNKDVPGLPLTSFCTIMCPCRPPDDDAEELRQANW